VAEFAVGHVCSAEWEEAEAPTGSQPHARWVATTWLPSAIVEGVDPNGHPYFAELGSEPGTFDPLLAEALASADSTTLRNGLVTFCDAYARWIETQRKRLEDAGDVPPALKHVAEAHLIQCDKALSRMRASVNELGANPRLRRAFQLANFAMHLQHSW